MQKWSYTPQMLSEHPTFDCSAAACLANCYLKNRNYEAFLENPIEHAINIVKLSNSEYFYLDPRNNLSQEMTVENVVDFEVLGFFVIKLSKPISGYSLIPILKDFQQGVKHLHAGNQRAMLEDMQSESKDLYSAAKYFEVFLKKHNLYEAYSDLPEIQGLLEFENTQFWQEEQKKFNLTNQVSDSLSLAGNLVREKNLNPQEIFEKGYDFVLKFLILDPNETLELNLLKNPDHAKLWQEFREIFWENTAPIRNMDRNLFEQEVAKIVEVLCPKEKD